MKRILFIYHSAENRVVNMLNRPIFNTFDHFKRILKHLWTIKVYIQGSLCYLTIFKTQNNVLSTLFDILYPDYDVHVEYARTYSIEDGAYGNAFSSLFSLFS